MITEDKNSEGHSYLKNKELKSMFKIQRKSLKFNEK